MLADTPFLCMCWRGRPGGRDQVGSGGLACEQVGGNGPARLDGVSQVGRGIRTRPAGLRPRGVCSLLCQREKETGEKRE